MQTPKKTNSCTYGKRLVKIFKKSLCQSKSAFMGSQKTFSVFFFFHKIFQYVCVQSHVKVKKK